MFPYQYIIFCIVSVTFVTVSAQYVDFISNFLYHQPQDAQRSRGDLNLMQEKLRYLQGLQPHEKVKIQLYYECLCPDCRLFDTTQFAPTVKKLNEYLDIHVYPYGNAHTIVHDNGTVEIVCQHGSDECYGNKLHACAIDILGNLTEAIYFNTCMMDSSQANRGSDDLAADKCGKQMNIDTEPIKACAKGPRGFELLKAYGEESKKVTYPGVPYILINGVENDGDKFMRDVCAAFKNPPPECKSNRMSYFYNIDK